MMMMMKTTVTHEYKYTHTTHMRQIVRLLYYSAWIPPTCTHPQSMASISISVQCMALCVCVSSRARLNCIMMRKILYSYAPLLSGQSAAYETSILRVLKRRRHTTLRSGCNVDWFENIRAEVLLQYVLGSPAAAHAMLGWIPRLTLNSTHAHLSHAVDRMRCHISVASDRTCHAPSTAQRAMER